MGIFDRLFGGRYTLPPPDEPTLSDAAIRRELRAGGMEHKQALKELLDCLLERIPEEEGARLHRRIMRKYAVDGDSEAAISEGLLDDARGQKLEHMVLLSVDMRGFDCFEYLAPYLARGSGVKEPYHYRHDGVSHMSEVLGSFDRWLVPFGKRFLHIDSGGDSYEGVIVDSEQVQRIVDLAQLAGLKVSLQAF